MAETRHIKLNYEGALSAKKQLLSCELNLLHTIKRIKNYKILRKRETATKNKLKTSITSLKSKLNLIQSKFPEQETKLKNYKRKNHRTEKEEGIREQLDEIKNKLAKLK